jgi:hypothetical protein
MFYMLETTLTLRLGDRTIKAAAGSLAGVPPGVVHPPRRRRRSHRPVQLQHAGTVLAVSGADGIHEATPRRGLRSASQHERRPRLTLLASRSATLARPAVQREAATATLSLVRTRFAIGPSR